MEMPAKKRFKTKYQGVYFIEGTATGSGKKERIYYIMYRKDGKLIEEKAGRQLQDDMTPARASHLRTEKIQGTRLPNKEKRFKEIAEQNAKQNVWTLTRIWEEYKSQKPESKSLKVDDGRFNKYLKGQFGETEPKNLVQLDIDRMRAKLLKKLAPQTVKHILGILQRMINYAVKKQLCSGPGFKIEYPDVFNERIEDLSSEQLKRLLEEIERDPNLQAANMMKMALYTGMRRGEMFKLKWDDIKFDTGFYPYRRPKRGSRPEDTIERCSPRITEETPEDEKSICLPWEKWQSANRHQKPGQPNKRKSRHPKRLSSSSWLTSCVCIHACQFR